MADILKFYGSNFTISDPFYSIPLEWFTPAKQTYSKKLLRTSQTQEAKKALKFKSIISAATFALILFQAIQNSLCQNDAAKSSILNWMLLFLLTMGNYHVYICRIKAIEMSAFINGLIQFEQMYPKIPHRFKKMKLQELACLATVFGVTASQYILPFGITFGFHWVYPWKFSLAGYWLIPKPNNITGSILARGVALGIKILVMVYNCWIWYFVIFGTGFVVAGLHNVCINTILKYVEM